MQLFIPCLVQGYFIMEMYFMAVVLPEELNVRIRKYKEWMKEEWGCKVGLKSPAHITMVPPFWMESSKEESLITALEKVCLNYPSFLLATADFSAFVPRTLFIALQPNPQLALLKQEIEKELSLSSEFKIKKEARPFHPHITIATRDVHKAAFHAAWDYFKAKEFRESWTTEGVSILKHNRKDWDVWHTASLKKEEHAG